MTVIEETPHQWVLLDAGSVQIGLHKIGETYLTAQAGKFKVNTNTKLVFNIDDDIGLLRLKLLDNGVMVKEIKTFPGSDSLFCDGEDPEGNVFQLEERVA